MMIDEDDFEELNEKKEPNEPHSRAKELKLFTMCL